MGQDKSRQKEERTSLAGSFARNLVDEPSRAELAVWRHAIVKFEGEQLERRVGKGEGASRGSTFKELANNSCHSRSWMFVHHRGMLWL